jgi:hypothetical protein
MATFIQGVTDEFGTIVPYQPDWNFLNQVYGTKQAEYDRGFNMVKNLYSSLLNSPLTNSENDQFRSDMFRKIQGSLRNVSGIDLSDPNNIRKAMSIMDPISQDQEIVYDMKVTEFHQKQKQKMEQYKNSSDPKVRAMYSKYSAQDIAFSEEDLRSSKRGDGSITSVQPREFVPFEDVNEYLRAAAKDAGLKIEVEGPDGRGYILKKTNGEIAKVPFAQWAAVTMGNRFDRQFDVIGRVEAEGQIRSLVRDKGISRQDAINATARTLTPVVQQEATKERDVASMNIAQLEDEISFYKNTYGGKGFPANKPEVEQRFRELVEARDGYKDNYANSDQVVKSIEEEGEQYVAGNIYSHLAKLAKQQSAVNWATVTADATAGLEVKPDQTWISKAQIASREREAALDRQLRLKVHNETMAWNQYKFGQDQELKIKIAQGKGELASEERLGAYTPGGDKNMFGVDVLDKATSKVRGDLFNNAFAVNNGLINLAISDKSKLGEYSKVINKLNSMAEGGKQTLSKQELAVLQEYGKKVGRDYQIGMPGSASQAGAILDDLALHTYNRAVKMLDHYQATGKQKDAYKFAQGFKGTLDATRQLVQQRTNVTKNHRAINKVILNSDGTLKESYSAAKLVGRFADGTPIYDLDNVPEAQKNHLNKVVSTEFVSRSKPIGNSYEFNKISSSEIFAAFNSNFSKATTTTDEKLDINMLKNLSSAELKELFADQAKVDYDPVSEKVIMELNVAVGSKPAGKLGLKKPGAIKVEIPYSTIKASKGSLSRLEKYIDYNSVVPDSFGIFEEFSRNPKSTVRAPQWMNSMGFDFIAIGSNDVNGRYGVDLTYRTKDPVTGEMMEHPSNFLALDPSDPDSWLKLTQTVNASFDQHQYLTGAYIDATNKDDQIYYVPDVYRQN